MHIRALFITTTTLVLAMPSATLQVPTPINVETSSFATPIENGNGDVGVFHMPTEDTATKPPRRPFVDIHGVVVNIDQDHEGRCVKSCGKCPADLATLEFQACVTAFFECNAACLRFNYYAGGLAV